MAAQQLAHPPRAHLHPGALLQEGSQPPTRPACEGKAQVAWVRLHCLHQQAEVLLCDARWPSRTRRVRQSLYAEKTPPLAAAVHRPGSHSQRPSDAGRTHPLLAPQDNSGAQGHCAPHLVAQHLLKLLPLGSG